MSNEKSTPVYIGSHRVLMRTIFGQILVVDAKDRLIAPRLLLDGYWEAEVSELLRKFLKKGMQFVDIGANIGYFTTMAASLVGSTGKVCAFEPDPSCFELLNVNMGLNWFPQNFSLTRKAVAETSGPVTFYSRRYFPGNSRLAATSEDQLAGLLDEQHAIIVECTCLDDYLVGDERVDLMKIDIEGYEPAVFRGMRRVLEATPRLAIIIEWSPGQMITAGENPGSFFDHLVESGFSAKSIEGGMQPVHKDYLANLDHCNLFLERNAI